MSNISLIYAEPGCDTVYYLGSVSNDSETSVRKLLDVAGLDEGGIKAFIAEQGWDHFDYSAVRAVLTLSDIDLEQGDEVPMARIILNTSEGFRYIEAPWLGISGIWDFIELYDEINGTNIFGTFDEEHMFMEDSPLRCPPYDGEPQHADDDEEAA